MSDFQPGEIVDVAIKGVRIRADVPGKGLVLGVSIIDETGVAFSMPPQAKITRIAPAEWPPQKGDLWRDQDGHLWVGIERFDEAPFIELECVNHGRTSPAWAEPGNDMVNQQFGPLTLVRREEATS